MNLTDVTGRTVLDLATATELGRVDDYVIDPASRQIIGFHLAGAAGNASWLSWDAITAVGADALTVEHGEVLTDPPEDGRRLRADAVLKGRVLTTAGRELAELTDLEFDADTGQITAVTVGDRSMPSDALVGVGRYATVVTDPQD